MAQTNGGHRFVSLPLAFGYPVSPNPVVPQIARETLYWDRPFKTVRSGSFETGDIVWFPEGGLNASYNCVDRWAYTQPDKVRTERRFGFLPSPWSPTVDQRP